jgi:hypothetical protein
VQLLLEQLGGLAPYQQQQQAGVSDTLQALVFACCGHPSNLQQLADAEAALQLTLGELHPFWLSSRPVPPATQTGFRSNTTSQWGFPLSSSVLGRALDAAAGSRGFQFKQRLSVSVAS